MTTTSHPPYDPTSGFEMGLLAAKRQERIDRLEATELTDYGDGRLLGMQDAANRLRPVLGCER